MPAPPFIIELEFVRAVEAGDPFAFHFSPQDYLLRSAGGGFENARFSWDESLLADLQAVRRSARDPVLRQRLGETLRRFLAPLGWAEQERRILDATVQGRRVLITFRSAAAELYALPWELLTLKASGQHVGELAGVLLRYEWPDTISGPSPPRSLPGRVVLAWSAKGGVVPAAEHTRAIAKACREGARPFVASRDVVGNLSLRRLSVLLEEAKREQQPIAVLHLLCHGSSVGSSFGLRLDGEDEMAESVVVDGSHLRQILAPHASTLRLVVLMACDSGNVGAIGNQLGSIAQTLHRAGIASVIASRYPLSVTGSIRLTESLYAGFLGRREPLESALLAARGELATDAVHADWASVQLYARAADGAETWPLGRAAGHTGGNWRRLAVLVGGSLLLVGMLLAGALLALALRPDPPANMSRMPGGAFTMVEPYKVALEVPPYWLDRYEVTRSDFLAWVRARQGVQHDSGKVSDLNGELLVDLAVAGIDLADNRRLAVSGVSHAGAARYCQAQGKRLPRYEEWDLAARGAAQLHDFPWGDAPPSCSGVVFGRNRIRGGDFASCAASGPPGPAEVGTAAQDRTADDLYDLAGNVSEWVDAVGEQRYIRGGSWARDAVGCKTNYYARPRAGTGYPDVGFRCAKDLESFWREAK